MSNQKISPIRIGRSNASKNILYSLMLFGAGAIFGGFVGVYIFLNITGGSAQPSQPISAPSLSLESNTGLNQSAELADGANQPDIVDTEPAEPIITSETEMNDEPNEASIPSSAETNNQSNEASEAAVVTEAQAAPVQNEAALPPKLFRIVSEESEARFSVYETFPEGTAVGRTNQIAGDIIVDFNNPSNSQLGTIRINLRTLQTDDPDRDRSIRCCVLLTAQQAYEFADFVPTALTGLPSQVAIGQSIPFQVTGDLTLRGVTRPVTFDINLLVVHEDLLQGLATTIVNRTDFSILNNSDNGFDYHGVEEEVELEFEFVARSVTE